MGGIGFYCDFCGLNYSWFKIEMSSEHDYFDFRVEDDLPEENSSEMKLCPFCSNPIGVDSLFCLYCGKAVSFKKKSHWTIIVTILVLTAFLALWFFSGKV